MGVGSVGTVLTRRPPADAEAAGGRRGAYEAGDAAGGGWCATGGVRTANFGDRGGRATPVDVSQSTLTLDLDP